MKKSLTATPKPPATRKKSAAKIPGDAVTIGELRALMRQFVAEREWNKYHIPRNLAASVAVEAGELLELFQWHTESEGDRRHKDVAAEADFRRAVGEEMTDVLMYLMSLANSLNLDLGAAIFAKMEKNRIKYPAHLVRGHFKRPLT